MIPRIRSRLFFIALVIVMHSIAIAEMIMGSLFVHQSSSSIITITDGIPDISKEYKFVMREFLVLIK